MLLPILGQVVLAIIADAEVTPSGSVPVTEEHRQCAPARRQRDRAAIAVWAGRADQLVVEAEVMRLIELRPQVVAESERRKRRTGLPCGAEGLGWLFAAVEVPALVRPFEPAIPKAAKQNVLPVAQHREVHLAIAVDVERIRAIDIQERGSSIGHPGKPQRTTEQALVPEEGSRLRAASEIDVRPAITIAVEDRHSAANREVEATAVDVRQA